MAEISSASRGPDGENDMMDTLDEINFVKVARTATSLDVEDGRCRSRSKQ
jgi:hypothetical protein